MPPRPTLKPCTVAVAPSNKSAPLPSLGFTPVTSKSGGASLDSVSAPRASDAQLHALRAAGFAWDKTGKVYLRLSISPSVQTSLNDLLAIDALRVLYKHGTCLLTPRAYYGAAIEATKAICASERFALGKQPDGSWAYSKRMTAADCDALHKRAGVRSTERANERQSISQHASVVARRCANAEQRVRLRVATIDKHAHRNPSYARRLHQYGVLLRRMQRDGTYSCGADGAPCWPDPPAPNETGIVSAATLHLVC